MANLIFKKGSYADFKAKVTTAQEGAFYLTEDEGGLYVGLADGSSKRIQGSVVMCDNIDDIVSKVGQPPYDPNVIYFSAANNALFRYNGTKWIQLNQVADEVNASLQTLQNNIDKVSQALNAYKTSNDAAVATKAAAADLTAEIARAKKAEGDNATAAKNAQSAADAAQADATSALANAQTNSASINSLSTKVTEVETLAKSKTTMAEVEAKGYATVAQVNSAKSELLGASNDASTKNTIYGAQKGVEEAKKAASDANANANTKLSLSGGTMSGDITMGEKGIIYIPAAPTGNTMAANKKYVDDAVANANSVSDGLNTRLTTAEANIAKNATAAKNAQEAADAAQSTANTGVTNAAAAQKAADAANANANTRLLQTDYDADKLVIEGDIEAAQAAADAAQAAADKAQSELNAYKTSNDAALAKKLDSTTASTTYATKTELNNAKSALLGATTDTSDKNTIYGAKAGVTEAKAAAATADSKAVAAQTTANTANSTANTNKTNLAAEITRAKEAEEALNTAVGKKVDQSAYNTKVAALESSISANKTAAENAQKTANAALPLAGGTMTGNIAMGGKKITGLANGTADSDAATYGQIKSAIAANDAMEFKGVIGSGTGQIAALPTSGVQKGWTYKVGAAYSFTDADGAKINAKIGDLIINVAADNATPSWVHVSSGYEDDYLQKMVAGSTTNGITIGISDGVTNSTANSSITLANANGIQWSVSGSTATPSIVWGTF